jgi:hypothetical protein
MHYLYAVLSIILLLLFISKKTNRDSAPSPLDLEEEQDVVMEEFREQKPAEQASAEQEAVEQELPKPRKNRWLAPRRWLGHIGKRQGVLIR